MKKSRTASIIPTTLAGASLAQVKGGEDTKKSTEKASGFEPHFTCEPVDLTNIK